MAMRSIERCFSTIIHARTGYDVGSKGERVEGASYGVSITNGRFTTFEMHDN